MYEEYVRGGVGSREEYFERLGMEFPGAGREVVERVDEGLESERWVETKIRALL